MGEFVVDYLLCNFDSHGANFIVDKYGRIKGVDKEQAFKHLMSNEYNFLDITSNPNEAYGEQESIYNYLFRRYTEGSVDIDFSILDSFISKAEGISDEEYKRIFHRYTSEISSTFG